MPSIGGKLMHHLVQAQFRADKAAEFQGKLLDGSILAQKPDGKEIVASMQRAVINDSGSVEWSETCYCETPLKHERETVYDHFFSDMTTSEVAGYQEHIGQPFMAFLAEQAN
jgi:hypothetical protein